MGRGDGVEILPGPERLLHGPVAGDMGQKPQLNLTVVRIHQHTAWSGHEHPPQLAPQFGAGGDILQVGLCGAQPPRGRDRHLKAGAHPSVRADDLQKPVHIGTAELRILPVLQHVPYNGVLQLLQDLRVGGPAGLGPLAVGKPQAVKEDLPKLLGGVDIELPGVGVDLLLQGGDGPAELPAKGLQGPGVHPEAHQLHLRQHPAEGELNIKVELPHPGLLQLGGHFIVQGVHRGHPAEEGGVHLAGVRQSGEGVRLPEEGGGQFLLEPGGKKPVNAVVPRRGVQEVPRQGRVEDEPLRREAVFQQRPGQVLHLVGYLLDIRREEGC